MFRHNVWRGFGLVEFKIELYSSTRVTTDYKPIQFKVHAKVAYNKLKVFVVFCLVEFDSPFIKGLNYSLRFMLMLNYDKTQVVVVFYLVEFSVYYTFNSPYCLHFKTFIWGLQLLFYKCDLCSSRSPPCSHQSLLFLVESSLCDNYRL